ncbi:hypothetical protein MRX96_056436 [Rhipicephalus microplus]
MLNYRSPWYVLCSPHVRKSSIAMTKIGRDLVSLQERSSISLTTRLLVAGTWKRRSCRTSINDVWVNVVSTSVSMVTPCLNNLSQTSHLLGDHHDKHRVFVILHAKHVSLTHVKNILLLISIGSGDGKGCDSHEPRAIVHRYSR